MNDVDTADVNTDFNVTEPNSYQDLLDIIESQKQELMLLKNTITDLQQLISTKPQVKLIYN